MSDLKVILDLDGTIIDSKKAMIYSYSKVIDYIELEFGAVPDNVCITSLIGPRKSEVHKKLSIPPNSEFSEKANAIYTHAFFNYGVTLTKVYPGLINTLSNLADNETGLYIVTNRNQKFLDKILSFHDLYKYFQDALYDDGTSKAERIGKIINSCNSITSNKFLYIGDTEEDRYASESNEIDFLYAAYGYGRTENDFFVNSPLELLDAINRYKDGKYKFRKYSKDS